MRVGERRRAGERLDAAPVSFEPESAPVAAAPSETPPSPESSMELSAASYVEDATPEAEIQDLPSL